MGERLGREENEDKGRRMGEEGKDRADNGRRLWEEERRIREGDWGGTLGEMRVGDKSPERYYN